MWCLRKWSGYPGLKSHKVQNFFHFCWKFLEDISTFCRATDIPVLVMSALGFKFRVDSSLVCFWSTYLHTHFCTSQCSFCSVHLTRRRIFKKIQLLAKRFQSLSDHTDYIWPDLYLDLSLSLIGLNEMIWTLSFTRLIENQLAQLMKCSPIFAPSPPKFWWSRVNGYGLYM